MTALVLKEQQVVKQREAAELVQKQLDDEQLRIKQANSDLEKASREGAAAREAEQIALAQQRVMQDEKQKEVGRRQFELAAEKAKANLEIHSLLHQQGKPSTSVAKLLENLREVEALRHSHPNETTLPELQNSIEDSLFRVMKLLPAVSQHSLNEGAESDMSAVLSALVPVSSSVSTQELGVTVNEAATYVTSSLRRFQILISCPATSKIGYDATYFSKSAPEVLATSVSPGQTVGAVLIRFEAAEVASTSLLLCKLSPAGIELLTHYTIEDIPEHAEATRVAFSMTGTRVFVSIRRRLREFSAIYPFRELTVDDTFVQEQIASLQATRDDRLLVVERNRFHWYDIVNRRLMSSIGLASPLAAPVWSESQKLIWGRTGDNELTALSETGETVFSSFDFPLPKVEKFIPRHQRGQLAVLTNTPVKGVTLLDFEGSESEDETSAQLPFAGTNEASFAQAMMAGELLCCFDDVESQQALIAFNKQVHRIHLAEPFQAELLLAHSATIRRIIEYRRDQYLVLESGPGVTVYHPRVPATPTAFFRRQSPTFPMCASIESAFVVHLANGKLIRSYFPEHQLHAGEKLMPTVIKMQEAPTELFTRHLVSLGVDGGHFACLDGDRKLRLFKLVNADAREDLQDAELIRCQPFPTDETSDCLALCASTRLGKLVVLTAAGQIRSYSFESGQLKFDAELEVTRRALVQPGEISLHLARDVPRLVLSAPGMLYVWNLQTSMLVLRRELTSFQHRLCGISPDGRYVICGKTIFSIDDTHKQRGSDHFERILLDRHAVRCSEGRLIPVN